MLFLHLQKVLVVVLPTYIHNKENCQSAFLLSHRTNQGIAHQQELQVPEERGEEHYTENGAGRD